MKVSCKVTGKFDPNDSGDAGQDTSDQNALTNLQEYLAGTAPTLSDTDGNTYSDGNEVSADSDPLDTLSFPGAAADPAVGWFGLLFLAVTGVAVGCFQIKRQSFRLIALGLVVTIMLSIVPRVFADCSCTVGSGSSIIGHELFATSCPSDEPGHEYYYKRHQVWCRSGVVTRITTVNDMGPLTPESVAASYSGYRMLRNDSGTHFIAAVSGSTGFKGTIAGINFNGLNPGVYYTDFDEYCCHSTGSCPSSLPLDDDDDGYNICFDCNDSDDTINPGIDGDEDGTNACEDCDDSDPEASSGDSCYSAPPPGSFNGCEKEDCCQGPEQIGNPINMLTGNKFESETDVSFPTPNKNGLSFKRFYNSQSDETGPWATAGPTPINWNWPPA